MDDYLAGLSPGDRAALERVRAVVLGAVPVAAEGRSYGMPAFIYEGRPLLAFRAAKKHLSIFPFSPAAIDAVRDRLGDFELAKGTIRFTADTPVPEDVLTFSSGHERKRSPQPGEGRPSCPACRCPLLSRCGAEQRRRFVRIRLAGRALIAGCLPRCGSLITVRDPSRDAVQASRSPRR